MKKKIAVSIVLAILLHLMAGLAFGTELNIIRTSGDDWIAPLYDKFTEETGIKLNINAIPHREMIQAIEVMMRSGSSDVDIIHVDSPLTASYAVRGFLLPLDPYFDIENSGWTEAGIAAGSWDGKLYSAPFETSTQVMFYNKTLFDQAGLEYPPMDVEQRWTWEQVAEAAKKIKAATGKWGLAWQQINRPYQLLPLPQSLGGGSGVGPDGLAVDGYLNNEAWVKAFQFYYDCFNTWEISPKGITVDEVWDNFTAGNIGMIVAGTWSIPSAEEARASTGLDYGLAPHPYFEGGVPVTPTGSWHWGINAKSKNIEAAVKFIEFMTLREDIIDWRFKTGGQLVPHEAMFEIIKNDPNYQQFPLDIYHVAVYELANTAVVRPVTPGFVEWEDITIKAFEDIRNGTDPKTALDNAVRRLEPLMRRYK
ncbi:MAG TPA: sugar ABC transporter substrate-binding protein [Firmicutes bacterium]|nr:sugar ABC transporter substrate-binding protein [Bacillota bacterium]